MATPDLALLLCLAGLYTGFTVKAMRLKTVRSPRFSEDSFKRQCI